MIINTIKKWYAGGGSPSVYFSNQNFNITATGLTNISCPVGINVQPNQSMPGPVKVGYTRVKTEANAPNFTMRVAQITGDDGFGNTVLLYGGDGSATTVNMGYDIIEEWSCDLALQNVNIAVNIQSLTGNATLSVEVAAGP